MRARALLFLTALLVAGCTEAPEAPSVDSEAPPPAGGLPEAPPVNDSVSTVPIGPRTPVTMERFLLFENRTLGFVRGDAPELPEAKVAETLSPTTFYESFVKDFALTPWPTTMPFRSGFETTAPVQITLKFTSDQPAASTLPKASGFPPVGGWFGTPERYAFFMLATDAPDTLEAGKVYTVTLTATPPEGGFFLRKEDRLALHPYLAYATADGKSASYVVGGAEPAGFELPHVHFNISAPTATVVLDQAGEIGPNPAPTGDEHPAPVNIPFTIPADAVYVVLEVTGAPKAGSRIDIDVSARTAGGDLILGGSSPYANEQVILGPGNLKAYGRELVARVTAATTVGGTFALKATAYGP